MSGFYDPGGLILSNMNFKPWHQEITLAFSQPSSKQKHQWMLKARTKAAPFPTYWRSQESSPLTSQVILLLYLLLAWLHLEYSSSGLHNIKRMLRSLKVPRGGNKAVSRAGKHVLWAEVGTLSLSGLEEAERWPRCSWTGDLGRPFPTLLFSSLLFSSLFSLPNILPYATLSIPAKDQAHQMDTALFYWSAPSSHHGHWLSHALPEAKSHLLHIPVSHSSVLALGTGPTHISIINNTGGSLRSDSKGANVQTQRWRFRLYVTQSL